MKTKLIIGAAVVAVVAVLAVLAFLPSRRAKKFDEEYLADARAKGVEQRDAECMLGMVKMLALQQALDEHPEVRACADPTYNGTNCAFAREWAASAERYMKSCDEPEKGAAPEGGQTPE